MIHFSFWCGVRVAATDKVAKQRCAAAATAVGDRHRATAGGDGGLLMGHGGRDRKASERAATSNCGIGCAPHSCEVK